MIQSILFYSLSSLFPSFKNEHIFSVLLAGAMRDIYAGLTATDKSPEALHHDFVQKQHAIIFFYMILVKGGVSL